MAKRLAFGLVLVGLLSGLVVMNRPTSAQTASAQCTAAGKGAFDKGWVETTGAGVAYRCVPTFDASFRPSGAAWVRVNSDGTLGARLPE